MDLRQKILKLLYKQVSENKIPQIRKGMVEDFEQLVLDELAEAESQRSAARMKLQGDGSEKDS